MSDELPTVQLSIPTLTAHIVRHLDNSPGKLECVISENPVDFTRGEEGDFIISSIPLVAKGATELEDGNITGSGFFAALHLIHPENDMGLWYILEQLILLSFNRGREFERSQLGREPGERDDERDESSYNPDVEDGQTRQEFFDRLLVEDDASRFIDAEIAAGRNPHDTPESEE